jgi:energy-coupling factor transporter ATP-binding protein EcfA2
MAHIVEFSIAGLAGRKGTYTQTLDRHVNIFFGLNGSGKTSLLKILHSAMSGNSAILKSVPFQSAEVKVYSIQHDRVFTHTIKKDTTRPTEESSEIDTSNILSTFQEYIEAPTAVLFREVAKAQKSSDWKVTPQTRDRDRSGWAHRYLPTSRLYTGLKTLESSIIRSGIGVSEELLDQYYAETLQSLWRNYYTNILTAVRKAQEDGLANILKAVLSGGKQSKEKPHEVDIKTAYERVAKFLERQGSPGILGSLERFAKHYEENVQLRSVVSDIDEIEQRIARATAPRDQLQVLIQAMFTGNKEVHFGDTSIDVATDTKEKIGLHTLSSGEKHLLRILIETLLAAQNSILIDEPELSMHVDWQKELIKIMQQLNQDAQIIMATHSPEIMANVSDDRIFRL